jgi:tRNA(fMet)-specific endonuclease VapC
MSYLIDTDIVADYLNGRQQAVQLLQSFPPSAIAISIITYGEIIQGVLFGQNVAVHHRGFRQFLRIASVVTLNQQIMRQFATVRDALTKQGNLIPDMDLLIGATALATNRTLVTRNRRHFNRLQQFGLTILP